VLVARTSGPTASGESTVIDRALQAANVESTDLGADFSEWANSTKEGSVEIADLAGREGMKRLRWRIHIDHEVDGGEGGKYPVGWPRVAKTFRPDELDMSAYDYLSFRVRVDSDRDEVADDSTRLGLLVGSHDKPRSLLQTRVNLGDRQRLWIPLRFSVREMIREAGLGDDPWKTISRVQLFIAEGDYAHGDRLTFDVSEFQLLRFTSPMIQRVDVPKFFVLPEARLPILFNVLGDRSVKKGSHTISAALTSAEGRTVAKRRQDLADGSVVVLDTPTLAPGRCQLKLTIEDRDGKACSRETCEIEAVEGPLYSK
jgi:hypothetical protein